MRSLLALGVIAAAVLCNSTASGQLQTVAIDDFEGLTLQDFTFASVGVDSGRAVYTRTNSAFTADWTVDNSLMDPNWNDPSITDAFDGWAVWESDYWIENQGIQDVRGIADADFVATGNHFLLADPDAWDDYQTGASSSDGYGSWVEREYNLTGNLQTLEIEMDWEFAAEDLQLGLIQVSFDGKQSWITLEELDSQVIDGTGIGVGNDVFGGANIVYSVANGDFGQSPALSNTMCIRFTCTGGNDWHFAIDDLEVRTDTFNEFDDFEGLVDMNFFIPYNNTTVWTQDLGADWKLDNSLMTILSLEGAYDGMTAIDVDAWLAEAGAQNETGYFGRDLWAQIDPNNTVLQGDPDEAYDAVENRADPNDPVPGDGFHSRFTRCYMMKDWDTTTVEISFFYNFRAEDNQQGYVEVSFDCGQTWDRFLELDSSDVAGNGGDDTFQGLPGMTSLTASSANLAQLDPNMTKQSNVMWLRFGTFGDNDWWFAIDDIEVRAEPIVILLGDADGSGVINFDDLDPFVDALFFPGTYAQNYPNIDPDVVLDMNCDGKLTFDDLDPFVDLLFN